MPTGNKDRIAEPTWSASRKEVYEFFCIDAPLLDNPLLDDEKEAREVLAACVCGQEYRLIVNGLTPIPDAPWDEMEVQCPGCARSPGQAYMISGHSGGCFNASICWSHRFQDRVDERAGSMMNEQLRKKVLSLAAQICWMHGSVAGDRTFGDWSADTKVLDSLTPQERDQLLFQLEQYNSDGKDFEPGYFPYDEMVISFAVARALEVMTETASISAPGRLDK